MGGVGPCAGVQGRCGKPSVETRANIWIVGFLAEQDNPLHRLFIGAARVSI
jgi:hypothetical protein